MLFDFVKYALKDQSLPAPLLIYQGFQLSVKIEKYASYRRVLITGSGINITVRCSPENSLLLVADIEKSLVYNPLDHPEAFL